MNNMDNDKKIEFKDKYTQEEISKQTIFISIASYRDNQLPKTIQSLLDNAEYPERITIGVLHQIDYENDVDCIYKGDNKNIKTTISDKIYANITIDNNNNIIKTSLLNVKKGYSLLPSPLKSLECSWQFVYKPWKRSLC